MKQKRSVLIFAIPTPRKIQKHLELAQEKEKQQDYDGALAEYGAVLELNPECTDVSQKIVMLNYKMEQFTDFEIQAKALWETCQEITRGVYESHKRYQRQECHQQKS